MSIIESLGTPAPWMQQAACAEIGGDICFPDKHDLKAIAVAKKVCEGCDVRTKCLEFALENRETHGVYGGLTTKERNKVIKARGLKPLAMSVSS